jgi:hypothetical protein
VGEKVYDYDAPVKKLVDAAPEVAALPLAAK